MANVKFLRGTQGKLDTLTSYTEGAFYLTEDTNRLYVAQSASSLVLLNQTVRIVDNKAALDVLSPVAANDFCYLSEENILAVYNGTKWVQINPDTVLVNSTAGLATEAITDGVKATLAVADSTNHKVTGAVEFIAKTDNVTISRSASGQIEFSVAAPETVEYALEQAAEGKKFELNRTVGGATTKVGSIEFADGTNTSVVVADGVVTYSAKDTTNRAMSAQAAQGEGKHGFEFAVTDSDSNSVKASIDPIIKIGKTENQVHFDGGIADLDVYTISEVDTLLADYEKKVDAMTYKGTTAVIPTGAGENGDVLKLSADLETGEKAGDLFIYYNGTWEYVPSGNEDTTYTLANGTHEISIVNATNTADKVGIKVSGISENPISVDGKNEDKTAKITVSHKAIETEAATSDAANQAAKGELSFNVVEALEDDGYGHITKVTTKAIKVVDTHANVNGVSHAVAVAEGVATVSTTVTDSDGATVSGSFSMQSKEKSLEVTAVDGAVNVELVWGSF